MAMQDDVRTSKVALIGFIGALVCFVLIVMIQVLYYRNEARLDQIKNVQVTPLELNTLVSRQQALLNSYAAVDPAKTKVLIPIDRAMQLVVREITADPKKACPWGVVVAVTNPPPAAKDAPQPAPQGKPSAAPPEKAAVDAKPADKPAKTNPPAEKKTEKPAEKPAAKSVAKPVAAPEKPQAKGTEK